MTDNPIQIYLRDTLPSINPRYQRNDVQCAYAGSISLSLAQGPGSINCIEGDTGIGKTLAYTLTLADWVARGKRLGRQAVLSTYSRALQRQLMQPETWEVVEDYLSRQGLPSLTVGLRMGRSNYVCPHRLASALGYPSLEAVLSDDSASNADRSLASWGLSGGLLFDIDESQLPDDVVLGDIALHPSDPLPRGVQEQFEDTQGCDIQIINHALLALDIVRNNQITCTDAPVVMLLDEAEHFPAVAESMLSERLSFRRTANILRQNMQMKAAEVWESLFNQWKDVGKAGKATSLHISDRHFLIAALEKLKKARPGKHASKEARHELTEAKNSATRFIGQILGDGEGLVISYSPEYGYPSLVLLDSTAGSLLKAGGSERITLMTSATLSDCNQSSPQESPRFDYLRRRLLLPAHSDLLGVLTAHQAHTFGQLDFRLPGIDLAPMVAMGAGTFQLNPRFAKRVWDDIEAFDCSGRQLLLCVSYSDVDVLVDNAPATLKARIVTHSSGASLTGLAETMPEDGILLTPAGWEGLSPERDNKAFWSHVGVLRSPTPRPDPVEAFIRERWLSRKMSGVQAKQAASASLHQESRVQTLHKLRQGIGRALRHPDDSSVITFYDPRFPTGRDVRNVKSHSWLSNAVPFRFRLALKRAQETDQVKPNKSPVLIL